MTPLWTDIGWTMLHTLWAGALVGVLAAVARRGLADAPAERRYAVAALAFVLMLLTPLALFVVVRDTTAASKAITSITTPSGAELMAPNTQPLTTGGLTRWVAYLPWLWLAGTSAMLLSLLRGAAGVRGLRRDVQPAPGRVQALTARLAHGLRARADVIVVVSTRVRSPLLVGIVRPLIVLPPALLAGLTPQQLELVLLHELAHLLRRDNLVIALQRVGEALLFFHPVTWWLSRWLRLERESCCDALVLQRAGRPEAYVRTLLAVAEGATPSLSAAMARHDLPQRVSRILGRRERPMPTLGTTTAVSLTLLAGLGVLAGGTQAGPVHDETYPSRAARPVDAWHHPWFGDGSAITTDCTACHQLGDAPASAFGPSTPAQTPWAAHQPQALPTPAHPPAHAPAPFQAATPPAWPAPAPQPAGTPWAATPTPAAPARPGPAAPSQPADCDDDASVRDLLTEARRLLDDDQALHDDPRRLRDQLSELLAAAPSTTWPSADGFGAPAPADAPVAMWPGSGGFGSAQVPDAPAKPGGEWPSQGGFGAAPTPPAPGAEWPSQGGFGAATPSAPGAEWPSQGGFGAATPSAPDGEWPSQGGFGAAPTPPAPDGEWPSQGGFGAATPSAPDAEWPSQGGFGAAPTPPAPGAEWPSQGGFGAPQAPNAPGAEGPSPHGLAAPQAPGTPAVQWPSQGGFGAPQALEAPTSDEAPAPLPAWIAHPPVGSATDCASCHATAAPRTVVNAFMEPRASLVRAPATHRRR